MLIVPVELPRMAPPIEAAELPESVLLMIVTTALARLIPPPPLPRMRHRERCCCKSPTSELAV